MSALTPFLRIVIEHRQSLSREQSRELLTLILAADPADPNPDPALTLQTAALLGALTTRGETEHELAGFTDILRARATPLPLTERERQNLTDTCGTGGDASNTFNISTAAALVAAAASAAAAAPMMVAKHGNRAVTSRSGSADVLEALGIPVDHTPQSAAEALRTHRFAFLSAPAHHPAMAAVMPIRRALGVRTVFNILGPLSNPAGASAQLMGVFSPRLVPVAAAALAQLHTRHAYVVHGSGLDEFSITGPSIVAEVIEDQVQSGVLLPEAFGLPLAPHADLSGGDAPHNAAILRAIFAGEPGPRRDVVVMNAAAVLITANLADTFLEGATLAQRTLDSGAVTALVARLSAR